MDEKNFSLINFKDLSEAAINFLSVIEKAIGWIPPIGNIIDFNEGINVYKESIKQDDNLCAVVKGAKIANARREVRHYLNQCNIVGVALENLTTVNYIKEEDYEWLDEFFEKARLISNKTMQVMWGKLLVYKFNDNEGISRKLLNVFSTVDEEDIKTFMQICTFTMDNVDEPKAKYPFIYILNTPGYYNDRGLRRYHLVELARTGLIEYNILEGFSLPQKKPKLNYNGKHIVFKDKERICYGNVRLTSLGCRLYDISEIKKDDSFLEFCISIWEKKNFVYDIS